MLCGRRPFYFLIWGNIEHTFFYFEKKKKQKNLIRENTLERIAICYTSNWYFIWHHFKGWIHNIDIKKLSNNIFHCVLPQIGHLHHISIYIENHKSVEVYIKMIEGIMEKSSSIFYFLTSDENCHLDCFLRMCFAKKLGKWFNINTDRIQLWFFHFSWVWLSKGFGSILISTKIKCLIFIYFLILLSFRN